MASGLQRAHVRPLPYLPTRRRRGAYGVVRLPDHARRRQRLTPRRVPGPCATTLVGLGQAALAPRRVGATYGTTRQMATAMAPALEARVRGSALRADVRTVIKPAASVTSLTFEPPILATRLHALHGRLPLTIHVARNTLRRPSIPSTRVGASLPYERLATTTRAVHTTA